MLKVLPYIPGRKPELLPIFPSELCPSAPTLLCQRQGREIQPLGFSVASVKVSYQKRPFPRVQIKLWLKSLGEIPLCGCLQWIQKFVKHFHLLRSLAVDLSL